MTVIGDNLHIFCEADDQPAPDLPRAIVTGHLTRFGKRGGIQLGWHQSFSPA